MRNRRVWAAAIATGIGALQCAPVLAQLAAFPGAQGFGAAATGGRGGSIYVVTNYNSSGSGSFADAVGGSNRIVVFAVGGYVNMSAAISAKSNLTILGQTAPGQGIAFMGHEVSFNNASNDIVQYIRAREGNTDTSAKASINLGGTTNMILDHVDAEFSQYDNIDAVGSPTTNSITLQNSLLADPIKAQVFNMHTEGNNTTYLNNLFANAEGRSVLAKSNTQFVNNSIYDYGYAYTTGNSMGVFSYDLINNYFVAGPSTNSAGDAWYQLDSNQSAYSSGNLLDSNKNGVLDGSATTPGGLKTLTAEWAPSTQYLPTLSAAASYAFNLAHAGALYPNGDGTFSRDQVDSQIVSQVATDGTGGKIYNEQYDNGLSNNGFGTLTTATVSANTLDTVPFSWLMSHGLSTANAAQLVLPNALGYDMIEEYAQQIGDQYASQTASSGDWNTTAWSAAKPGIYDHALVRGTGVANGMVTIAGTESDSAFTVSIGGNGPAVGESLNISGGSLTVQDTIYVGDQNNGSLVMTGGKIRANNIQLGDTVWNANGSSSTTYTGTLILNGGVLTTGQVVPGGGTAGSWTSGGSISWSGGTLQSIGVLSVKVPATLGAGGGILDTNAGTATIAGVMSGSGGFKIIGGGVLTLVATNTYTGATTISGATLIVNPLANGGVPSLLGASSNAAANLVLDAGMLIGTGSTDRLFTLTARGGTLDNSNGVSFTNTGAIALPAANVTLTLTGSSTAHNLFNASLADAASGHVSSVTKTGTGKWTFSSDGTKTYSGPTTIVAGQLEALSGDGFSHFSDLVIDSGASLEMHDNSVTINALQGSGAIFNSFTNGTHTLTIGAQNDNGTWSGNISSGATLNVVKAGTGAEIFTAANNYVGNTTVTGGTLTLALTGSVVSPALFTSSGATLNLDGSVPTTATLTSAGTINIGANTGTGILPITLGGITASSGGMVTVQDSGMHANRTLLVTSALAFGGAANSWQGSLDLGGNDLVVHNGNLAAMSNQTMQGLGSATGGIVSSTAASDTRHLTTIGVIQNSTDGTPGGPAFYGSGNPLGLFDNSSPVNTDVLAKYTYYGDANLDGRVDGSDYSRIDAGFAGNSTGWYNGDFNYDGVVNGSDYTLIDNAFNTQGSSLTTEVADPNAVITAEVASGASVPEPRLVGILALASSGLLGRRRSHPRRANSSIS